MQPGSIFANYAAMVNDDTYTHSVFELSNESGGTLTNNGTWTSQSNAIVTNRGDLINSAASSWSNDGSLSNELGGTLTNNGTLVNGLVLTNRGTLTNAGVINNAGGTFNQNAGRFTTSELFTGGTFNFTGGTLEITDSNQTLEVTATEFSFSNGSTFKAGLGGTTLGSLHNLELAGVATVKSFAKLNLKGGNLTASSIVNDGVIHLESGTSTIAGNIQNTGSFQVDSGSGLIFLNDLSGTGPFTGSGEVTFLGGLNPGNSPGTIEFGGDVTLGASSLMTIEIAGLTTVDFDRLVLNNTDALLTIANGAALDVQLINGFSLGLNQEFIFADINGTNAPIGRFSGLGEGDLVGNFGGFDLFISYGAGTGNDISFFTSVPEPGSLLMYGLVCGLFGMQRRRRRRVRPDTVSPVRPAAI